MSAPLPDEVDVVVVGAGGAGMTAALAAAKQGLDVVLLEKSASFGGSTAQRGHLRIPDNYALRAAGEADGTAEAKRYLDAIVGDVIPKVRRDTYLDRGPEQMAELVLRDMQNRQQGRLLVWIARKNSLDALF